MVKRALVSMAFGFLGVVVALACWIAYQDHVTIINLVRIAHTHQAPPSQK